MIDPLAEVVSLLQPGAPFSKHVTGSNPWAVRRTELGQPFYAVVMEGRCLLAVDGHETIALEAGDFVLIPAARSFSMSSLDAGPLRDGGGEAVSPITPVPGGAWVGHPKGPADVRLLVGHCVFGAPDAALLVSLLPQWVHVRGERRLSTLVQLVGDEARAKRPARDVVLARLLEVLLIEALRSANSPAPPAGLARGLADTRLAAALRCMHAHPGRPWTVGQLAREAAMSRSAFFEQFSRAVGLAPMAYLLAWRMALARQLLRRKDAPSVAEIAEHVGYSSASTFGVAFTRHVGMPPARYGREAARQA